MTIEALHIESVSAALTGKIDVRGEVTGGASR